MIEAFVDTVVNRPIGEETGETTTAGIEELILASYVEIGLLLSGETRGWCILRRGRAAHRKAQVWTVLIDQRPVSGQDLGLQVRRKLGGVHYISSEFTSSTEIFRIIGA